MYNNPENISQAEIDFKLTFLYSGIISSGKTTNREKRIETLENYKSDKISKEDWIEKYCV